MEVMELINTNHVSSSIVAILFVYFYIKFVVEGKILKIEAKIEKVDTLDSEFKLMQKDFEYLKKSSDKQESDMSVMIQEIHKIKGSMLSLESYFKQIIENENKR